ncbi:MAG: uracil phosphoribosyltransferase [Eubacteriales bacterium]|nr:uracil phosphoribosyltransferase [Eubacteriales bacterium]
MEDNKVIISKHPLIKHKISILRDTRTGTNEFRRLCDEIGVLLGFEALRDLPIAEHEIETPMCSMKAPFLTGKKLAIVPVLRAGLGMVNGMLTLVPSAKIGHVGLYRDHETLEPKEYYCKLPESIAERLVIIIDPMLATGGSACAAVDFIKQRGGTQIKFVCIIAAPEGVKRLQEEHPDIEIYIGMLDDHLNEDGYIVPGLGDAGDRIFGTK